MWGASGRRRHSRRRLRSFKSCPRVGGIQKLKHQTQNQQGFKSCPRVGGIPLHSLHHQASFQVSSRAPVWGASLFRQILVCQHKSFKSCPRVGGILRQLFKISHRQVSSRAPVWGASYYRNTLICRISSFKSCPRVGGIGNSRRRRKL